MNAVTSDKRVAQIGTITLHIVVIGLLILMMRSCGSGTGTGQGAGPGYLSLDIAALGLPEEGLGPNSADPAAPSEEQPSTPEEVLDDKVVTEENAAVVVPTSDKPKKDPVKTPEKPADKPKEVSNPLNNALGKLGEKGSSSGQTTTGGNTGNPNGVITGKGVLGGGGGSGYEYSFARNMKLKPSLDEKPKDDGTVVVDIWVDKNGVVTKAVANPSHAKTNTSNSDLYRLAEKAAKNAKFEADASITGTQKGTITITFKLV